MATFNVNSVYVYVCLKILEDSGNFADGTYSQANFLLYFTDTINDFCTDTGISKMVFTQPIMLGVGQYNSPDPLTDVESMYVGGKYISKKTTDELDNLNFNWRSQSGVPASWHEDDLPIQTVEVYPYPSYNGPQYGIVQYPPGTNPPGVSGAFNPADGNLTMVGSQIPSQTTYTLTTVVPLVPNSAFQYLAWGVLARIWADDSENLDIKRSAYASSRYQEGVNIFRAIMLEFCNEESDEIIPS